MYRVGTNYIGACKSEVQMRTVPVHIAFLRVNSWYTGVLCLYKCASPRAIPWYIFVPRRHTPNCCLEFRNTILYRAGTRPVCACNSEVQCLPCRHKPCFPQMNRRYKICTVLAKPYISGRKAEVQVPVQIQMDLT